MDLSEVLLSMHETRTRVRSQVTFGIGILARVRTVSYTRHLCIMAPKVKKHILKVRQQMTAFQYGQIKAHMEHSISS